MLRDFRISIRFAAFFSIVVGVLLCGLLALAKVTHQHPIDVIRRTAFEMSLGIPAYALWFVFGVILYNRRAQHPKRSAFAIAGLIGLGISVVVHLYSVVAFHGVFEHKLVSLPVINVLTFVVLGIELILRFVSWLLLLLALVQTSTSGTLKGTT